MKIISAIATLFFVSGLIFVSGCAIQPESGLGKVDADAPTEFTETASGLKYRILRKSDGPKPSATDRVTVDYTGWLDNGTEFDSSYARREPTTFGLNEVVPGWTEGLQLVSEGGMIELEIPYQLGYGAQGSPGSIPPYSTLHFKVELHEIQ
ncbi:FKBP-type peptidyl-prolyl cis-trans isomerase [Novipirellula sp. SH528]|uniref:FKBP-type peptidyl-prolyl cis-trans isomerase n=1 Tax=Novipirellula sp. SH528 TaxID=3454466 RepID=UPI003F9F8526